MPVTLKQVVDHVLAMEEEGTDRRETLGAVGLLINASNDEIYSPAPKPSVVPMQQRNVRLRRRY
jgi:hypothetical protein